MTNPQGNPISLGKAAKKYSIPVSTLSNWTKDGKITVLQRPELRGQSLMVDEGSVIIAREAYIPAWKRGAPRQFPLPADFRPQPPSPPHPSTSLLAQDSAPTVAAASALKTADLVEAYLNHGRSVGFAANTIQHLTNILTRFAWVCPELPSTPEPISAFIASLSTSQMTKKNYFAKIKMFYGWLQEYHDIASPLKKGMAPRVMKKLPKVLSPEEKERLLAGIDNPQDRLMVNLILATGLRTTAVCNLTDKDVYTDYVSVRALPGSKTGAYDIPIPPWLYNRLKMQDAGYLFPDSRGKKMTRQALYDRVERSMVKAGIDGEKRGAHTLRHTAAVELLEATGDLDLVRQILGHTDIKTTQIYARLRPTAVQEKYQALSPMRNAPGEPGQQGSLDLDTN